MKEIYLVFTGYNYYPSGSDDLYSIKYSYKDALETLTLCKKEWGSIIKVVLSEDENKSKFEEVFRVTQ